MADEPTKLILGDTAISAIEQPATKRFLGRRKNRQRVQLTHCEHCGAHLSGKYCPQCGQPAIDYRRSFRQVIVDVLDSFLNWDSKFFATIGLLIAKPWRLTNEFLAGKRVRYVHPLRLYLLASILFFFAVNYWAKSIHFQPGQLSPKDRAELQAELKTEDLPPDARAKLEKALKLDSPMPTPATPDVSRPPGSPPESCTEYDGLDRNSLARIRGTDFYFDPACLSTRLVYERNQIFLRWFCLFDGSLRRACSDVFCYARDAMKKIIGLIFLFILFVSGAPAAQLIAFERNDAVWIASLDGTGAKKIADGIFPAISPDGT